MKKNLICILLLSMFHFGNAQITFQKQFSQLDAGSSFQTYDAKQTPDGGYVFTGLASEASSSSVYHPFIVKVNCRGEVQWEQFFGTTQTNANVNGKVIVLKDSSYVMINNLGVYSNYNGLAVKVSPNGNVVWQKLLNLSSGNQNDNITDIKETKDGHLILTGNAKSTADVAIVKLNADGSLVWSKTYGGTGNIDEGSAIIELVDGNYLVTGRYISMGTFNAFLTKIDTSGAILWHKCYGDTLQHMWGMDVKEMKNGDLFMAGSTTLLKPSFQSYGDNFLMKLNSLGDTLWTKIFYGTPDQFENVSSILLDSNENILLGVATASYATVGFVPNKHAIMKFDPSGNLFFAKSYNNGSSHYPRISQTFDGGYLLSGFTNAYSGPIGFKSLLIKLNASLSSGCNETNIINQTIVTSHSFKITEPIPQLSQAGSSINNSSNYVSTIQDSTLCESYPNVIANFTMDGGCINSPVLFHAYESGLTYWHWDFGNGDTSLSSIVSYTFSDSGFHTITLIVSNGCDFDTISKSIHIVAPLNSLNLNHDTTICLGQSITIGTSILADSYSWNSGDTTATIQVNQAGSYILNATMAPCGLISDTINIEVINCDTISNQTCEIVMPNAFSPNNDSNNDILRPIVLKNSTGLEFIQIQVYNRWGNLMYSSSEMNQGWDGNHHGTPQSTDSYYFFVKYSCNGALKVLKGDVLLLR